MLNFQNSYHRMWTNPPTPFQRLIKSILFSLLLAGLFSCESGDDPAPVPRSANGISGIVSDNMGNVYGNATLSLTQGGTFIRQETTDNTGAYQFPNLDLGDYEVALTIPKTTASNGANPKSVTIADSNGATVDFTVNTQPLNAAVVLGAADVLGEVRTQSGEIPSSPDDLLYAVNVFSNQDLVPITAPDGHHIQLSEWDTAQGTVIMTCMGASTVFEFSFTDLIPEGVYTLWIGPVNGTDILGTGAIGLSDGSQNNLEVDENGDGTLSVTMGTGPLSVFGDLDNCALTASTEFNLILDYHIDGNTYGSSPGPDPTEVGHMIFTF